MARQTGAEALTGSKPTHERVYEYSRPPARVNPNSQILRDSSCRCSSGTAGAADSLVVPWMATMERASARMTLADRSTPAAIPARIHAEEAVTPMGTSPGPSPDDEAALMAYATDLADRIEAAIPAWVARCVTARAGAHLDTRMQTAAEDAGHLAQRELGPRIRALLESDVDAQATNPLSLLREGVCFPTAVLREAGIAPVDRDAFVAEAFPDDVYDLSPASFADVDPSLQEPGLVWGAAKAHVVLARRRAEGRR